jgi:phosphotransferase system  glucose/maltose/N-acetylglucosamine-specific IIC component
MRIPFLIAAVCLLVSFTIYVIIDATFAPLILNMTNIPLDQVLADGKLRILFFLPQGLVMLLVVLLVFFFNFKLIDLSTLIMSREDEEWKR